MIESSRFTDVQGAVDEIRAGRMVVVVDDEDRENEGDLTMAAEKITPEAVNFMAKFGRGLICLAMTPERVEDLQLGPMSIQNTARFGTAFTQSIDALGHGVTTGISASDRAQTILCAIDPETRPSELARPGHVFPLRARAGGVLVRAGQTEASVDLARLAGLTPAGVICEIMNDDGSMARVPDLTEFCEEHKLKMITVAELIRYRMAHERFIHRLGSALLQTEFGEFSMIAYGSDLDGESHVALVYGDVESSNKPVFVRMQTRCLAGDVFHASSCECASNMRASMQQIAKEGSGALIYMQQNSLGFALKTVNGADSLEVHRDEKILHALEYQRTIQREVGIGAQILLDLNIRRILLMTNRPRRVASLEGYGIEIVAQIPIASSQTHGFDSREAQEIVNDNRIVSYV
jgi:3,4-dihydroxy 2-butanone 4-phosphate synthase / GTP cyclohydrolase II